ncbi:CoA-binding protein [bacterium]|nr:CoA-binding protein [bacterium]
MEMQKLVEDFLNQRSFAVVGSFRNETKYAYQIFKTLIEKGYEVFPVNMNISKVEGRVCYKTISDIPYSVDVVDIVTPPSVTEDILKECLQKGIKRVWLQPGAESQEVVKFCKENDIKVIHNICVMLDGIKKQKQQEGIPK